MNVNANVSWEDVVAVGVATLIPIGISGVALHLFGSNRSQVEFLSKLRKPNWAVVSPGACAALELAAVSPVGCAVHQICIQPSSQERNLALGLCGAAFVVTVGSIPIYMNSKNLKTWLGAKAMSTAAISATAYAFYKVHDKAGYMLVPLAAWCAYKTAETCAMTNLNPTCCD